MRCVDAGEAGRPTRPVLRRLRLPGEAGSPRRAREFLRSALHDGDRLDCLDAAELACTELVTNAVLHAHTDVEVTVTVDSAVRVAVRDFSPTAPLQRHYDVQATTGRGLGLVAAVADDHGVEDAGPEGKTMWFTVGDPAAERSDGVPPAWDEADWDLDAWPTSPTSARRHTVRFLAIPPSLWLAARQHHDAILRELVFYSTTHAVDVDMPAADRARSTISAAVVTAVEAAQRRGEARSVLPVGHPSPLPPVPAPFDLVLDVDPGMGADAAALQDALDRAEELAHAGKLLARPGLPEVVAVRDWACEQIQAQLSGVQAAPWSGTDEQRFVADVDVDAARQLEEFAVAVHVSERSVVAADDGNRIVAISERLARSLGWRPDDLVGRRIVALIPPRLREAHVAGFTRHLTTGEAHVLGVPLTLPVLRADGTEIQCRFLIEQTRPVPGRSMYIASIEPLETPGG